MELAGNHAGFMQIGNLILNLYKKSVYRLQPFYANLQALCVTGLWQELVVLGLALCALLVGTLPTAAFGLLKIGHPGGGAAVAAALADPWAWDKLWAGIGPVLVVAALVLGLRAWGQREASATTPSWPTGLARGLGRVLGWSDGVLRQWSVAGLSLLMLILLLAGTLRVWV